LGLGEKECPPPTGYRRRGPGQGDEACAWMTLRWHRGYCSITASPYI
jgi:hypothetical protein